MASFVYGDHGLDQLMFLENLAQQASHCTITINQSFIFILSVIYASTKWQRCKFLWNEILKLSQLSIPHLIAGDFNCITSSDLKKGGKAFKWGPGEMDLINLKNSYGLIDLGPSSDAFT